MTLRSQALEAQYGHPPSHLPRLQSCQVLQSLGRKSSVVQPNVVESSLPLRLCTTIR